jgi:hypothetical protein
MTGRIGILPLEWFGIFVVLANVAHELLVQVGGAGEDAAAMTSRWMRPNQFSTWFNQEL